MPPFQGSSYIAGISSSILVLEKTNLEKTTMSGRGGARHHAKPYVDTGILYKCLEKHEGLLSEMGAYEHISSNMAPDPKGLLHTMPLWRESLRVEPSGEIHSQPFRAALLSFLTEKPSLNHTNHSGQVCCNLKLDLHVMVWYGMVWYGMVCMYVCMYVCM